MTLNDKERATILAALRLWQDTGRPERPGIYGDIATDCGAFDQLTHDGINELADRLLFPPQDEAERQTKGTEEAFQACAMLEAAYQASDGSASAIDWQDIDDAWQTARAALQAAGQLEPESAEEVT